MKCAGLILAGLLMAACSSSSGNRLAATTTSTAASAATTTIDRPITLTQAESDPDHYEEVKLAAPSDAMSCTDASRSTNPDDLLAAFRAARLAGHGAEDCVDEAAMASYSTSCDDTGLQSDPGPIVLYRCGSHPIVRIPDREITAPKGDHTYVHLGIYFDGVSASYNEYVIVQSGRTAGSHELAHQLITQPSAI